MVRFMIAIARCGYATLASDLAEQASAWARLERKGVGRGSSIDSDAADQNSVLAARYANESQAFLDATAGEAAVPPISTSNALRVDLLQWSVSYRGTAISTSGPNGLTPQAVVALATLAKHAPKALTMPELADGMSTLAHSAGLREPTRAPVSIVRKYLIRRLKRPFLAAGIALEEFQRLFGTPGNGRLRINLQPSQITLEEAAATVRAKWRRAPGDATDKRGT